MPLMEHWEWVVGCSVTTPLWFSMWQWDGRIPGPLRAERGGNNNINRNDKDKMIVIILIIIKKFMMEALIWPLIVCIDAY